MSSSLQQVSLLLTSVTVMATPVEFVLNGSFEDNTASSTTWNMSDVDFNAAMSNVTATVQLEAFEPSGQMDIVMSGASFFPATTSGDYFVTLIDRDDRVALLLASTLTVGVVYNVSLRYSFWSFQHPNPSPIYIFAANSSGSFDSIIHTISNVTVDFAWHEVSFNYVAGVGINYIGVSGDKNHYLTTGLTGAASHSWFGIDAVSVLGPSSAIPEPSTYGLILGGLALAVVAARRRKISK